MVKSEISQYGRKDCVVRMCDMKPSQFGVVLEGEDIGCFVMRSNYGGTVYVTNLTKLGINGGWTFSGASGKGGPKVRLLPEIHIKLTQDI